MLRNRFEARGHHGRLLFVCKTRTDHYGRLASSGLYNSARMVAEALSFNGVDSAVVDVVDGNGIDRELHLYRPTHCIVEALWCPASKLEELARAHRGVTFVVRVHSRLPFLALEGAAVSMISELRDGARRLPGRIVIAPNTADTAVELAETIGALPVCLPNIYHNPDEHRVSGAGMEHLDVGCFGAIRPLKNQLIQAAAAIRWADGQGRAVRFHVNAGRPEQRGDDVLRNIRALFASSPGHELCEHPWMDYGVFLRLLRLMDVSMQCSYTETFNIVAADSVSQGCPVVGSAAIDWLPAACVANSNSSDSMVDRLREVTAPAHRRRISDECRQALRASSRAATKAWLDFLS